jgi:hypothetical protein
MTYIRKTKLKVLEDCIYTYTFFKKIKKDRLLTRIFLTYIINDTDSYLRFIHPKCFVCWELNPGPCVFSASITTELPPQPVRTKQQLLFSTYHVLDTTVRAGDTEVTKKKTKTKTPKN